MMEFLEETLNDPELSLDVFAIEAIRLVDHFQFRDKSNTKNQGNKTVTLSTGSQWVNAYYTPGDLLLKERTLLIGGQQGDKL